MGARRSAREVLKRIWKEKGIDEVVKWGLAARNGVLDSLQLQFSVFLEKFLNFYYSFAAARTKDLTTLSG